MMLNRYLLKTILTLILIFGIVYPYVTQAAPPAQDPRPPVDGGGGGGSSGGGGGSSSGGDNDDDGDNNVAGDRCATLFGQTISWGIGPVSRLVLLDGGSWEQSVISSSEGAYNFGNLGTGIARLQIPLAPEESGQVQPLIQDAGVYLNCNYPVIANIAMYGGPRIEPPAFIEISGPERLAQGSSIPLQITVKNDLPTGISNVIVTNLMPEGLIAQEIETEAVPEENLMIIDAGEDGQLAVAFLDELAAGQELDLFITVSASEDVPAGTQIRNTVTLLYRESAADQASLDFMISSAGEPTPTPAPTEAPVITTPAANAVTTPTPTPEFGLVPAAASDSGPPAPVEEAEDGADFVPPGKLPGTGGEETDITAPALTSESGSVPVAPIDSETADITAPVEEAEDSADFIPPAKLSDVEGEEVTIPPGMLPVTGQNGTLIFGILPQMGLVPISVLIGLGLGGLLSVYRHLYPSYRNREQD